MKAEDFFVLVVENNEAIDTKELKLTIVDVGHEITEPQNLETILENNGVSSNESGDMLDNKDTIQAGIRKEDIETLFEVIENKCVKIEPLQDDEFKLLDNNVMGSNVNLNHNINVDEIEPQNCESRDMIDNKEIIQSEIKNEDIETLVEDIEYEYVKEEPENLEEWLNVTDNEIVNSDSLPQDDISETNGIKLRDIGFNSILQIECPKKRIKRIFHFFKDTLLRNGNSILENYHETKYSYCDNVYICNYCFHSTGDEETAMIHYQSKHSHRIYFCLACKCTYRRRDRLRLHERSCVAEYAHVLRRARECIAPIRLKEIDKKTEATKSECRMCGKLISRSYMKIHLNSHTGVYYECDECGSRFPSKSSLAFHLNTHIRSTPYHCDQCPRSYSSKRVLTRHLLEHKSEQFICDVCGRNFLRPGSLQQHVKLNHTGQPYILCQLCGKSYKQKTSFRRHRCEMGKKSPIYQCMKCNKRFSKESTFKKHLNKKHGLDASKLFLDSIRKTGKVETYTFGKATMKKSRISTSMREE